MSGVRYAWQADVQARAVVRSVEALERSLGPDATPAVRDTVRLALLDAELLAQRVAAVRRRVAEVAAE